MNLRLGITMQGSDLVRELFEPQVPRRSPTCSAERAALWNEIRLGVAALPQGKVYEVLHNSQIAFESDGVTTVPVAECQECEEARDELASGGRAKLCIMHGTSVDVRVSRPTPGGVARAKSCSAELRKLGRVEEADALDEQLEILAPFSHLRCACGEPFGCCRTAGLRVIYPSGLRAITMCGSVFVGHEMPEAVMHVSSLTVADLQDTVQLLRTIVEKTK